MCHESWRGNERVRSRSLNANIRFSHSRTLSFPLPPPSSLLPPQLSAITWVPPPPLPPPSLTPSTDSDLERVNQMSDLDLAKELAHTCVDLYLDQATGIGPERVRFHQTLGENRKVRIGLLSPLPFLYLSLSLSYSL